MNNIIMTGSRTAAETHVASPPAMHAHYQQEQQQQQQQRYQWQSLHHQSPSSPLMSWTALSPSRTVVTSFTPRKPACSVSGVAFDDGDWVMCLAKPPFSSPSKKQQPNDILACALSNGEVQIYDTNRLHLITSFFGPSSSTAATNATRNSSSCLVTDLLYTSTDNPSTLMASRQDGTLVLMDLREQQQNGSAGSIQTVLPHKQIPSTLSLGYNGTIAAAGTLKGSIFFADWRKVVTATSNGSQLSPGNNDHASAWLGCYNNAHSSMEPVSQVLFYPSHQDRWYLLTASDDGLICQFDTQQPTEEAAIQGVCNVGSPVRRFGICHGTTTPSTTLAYVRTGSETVSLWDFDAAKCVHDFGWNLRHDLSTALNVQRPRHTSPSFLSPSSATPQSRDIELDYLVDLYWDSSTQELYLMAGTAQGDGALFRLAASTASSASSSSLLVSSSSSSAPSLAWHPYHVLTSGHRGVIRAWTPLTPNALISVGEDARLCEWTTATTSSNLNNNNNTDWSGYPNISNQQQPWEVSTNSNSLNMNKRDSTGLMEEDHHEPRRQRPRHGPYLPHA